MRRQQYFKLLLELLVIFLSVVLAFFFEDFRESRNEKNHYKTDLLTFKEELVGQINNISVKLDTFQIKDDLQYRGAKVKRLVNLMWFDSLISNGTASMTDFRFLLKSSFLIPEFGGYNRIALASEIRLKYTEQIRDKNLIKMLSIYDEEMNNLSLISQGINDSYVELDKLVRKMNPFLNFNRQDSLLLYSNEFIWTYKNCVENYESDFLYSKWLVQKRLITIVHSIDKELENLGEINSNEKNCLKPGFYDRFECENNRKIDASDSVSRVDVLTIKNRTKYLRTDLKERD